MSGSNKRRRAEDKPASPRAQQLRLSDELARKVGTQYCAENDLIAMMISQKVCSRVSTFVVKATLMGDLNEWMSITLDDAHASVADVKRGIELSKGLLPGMQELFRYDEAWTGTKGSGGSGHSAAQEDAALLEEGFIFEGPCSVLISVNESYDVVLEGQEEGDPQHQSMGVYERVEGKVVNSRGVWQMLGGKDCFLYHDSGVNGAQWIVGDKKDLDEGEGEGDMVVHSAAATPDQITEEWGVGSDVDMRLVTAPKLRVRVCNSVEKYAAEQRMEQEQEQALAQAQQAHTLVLEGLEVDPGSLMGVYKLVKGKVVNDRAVWQLQEDDDEDGAFLYFANNRRWYISDKTNMEKGLTGCMGLSTAALTPDCAHPSVVWAANDEDEEQMLAAHGVHLRRQS
jgi:hypothetical protein